MAVKQAETISIAEHSAQLTARAEPEFVSLVRLRCRLRVRWMRRLWAARRIDPGQGMAISDAEVEHCLADPLEACEAEAAFLEDDADAREIADEIKLVERRVAEDERWSWLQREFGLSKCELELLWLCVATEVDPGLRRVYGYLHDDATACHASQWLASSLFRWSAATVVCPNCSLVSWRMAWPADDSGQPWRALAPWVADPHMVDWCQGRAGIDPALGQAVGYFPASYSSKLPCLYPRQLAEMVEVADAANSGRAPVMLELIGPHGSGKRTLAAQLSAALGTGLVTVDATALAGNEGAGAAIEKSGSGKWVRAVRMARLCRAPLYWHEVDGIPPSLWAPVETSVPIMIFGTHLPLNLRWRKPVVRRTVRLRALTRSAQKALWQHLGPSTPPEPLDQWLMTPGDVVNAALAVPAGPQAVLEACRGAAQHASSELFSPLPCPFTWDDIVLPPLIREHLRELEQQARLRGAVYEDWGFGRLCPLGRGITAMFAGPSGVGKTMAAQVLARSLGMELYRVDLAGVMNKYIGETEKRIKQVFDLSERGNVLLFFDEADALFGQRTQVKDAHDRFANIEIDYLLQRMEQFDGIAVLATNRKGDLDKAFLRRIRFIVDFMQPGPVERRAIWRKVLPEHSPAGEQLVQDVDWDFLAKKVNLTGADITAAALSAAFLARAEGTLIEMKHILHSVRREMSKHGVMLRTGDWED